MGGGVMSQSQTNQVAAHQQAAKAQAPLTLEQLMTRHAQGDPEAFDELYRQAHPKLVNSMMKLTPDRGRAEDVAQVTLLKAHRARESYKPGAPVLPWLYVIAKRTLYDEQRPMSVRYEVLSNDGLLSDADRPIAPQTTDNVASLRQAFEQLPPHYRDAIELTKLSGFSGSEAAKALNTTKAAIKQRVHRGYGLLRQWLEPALDEAATA